MATVQAVKWNRHFKIPVMYTHNKRQSKFVTDNSKPVQLVNARFLEWISATNKMVLRRTRHAALLHLFKFIRDWTVEDSIGFKARANCHYHLLMMENRLKGTRSTEGRQHCKPALVRSRMHLHRQTKSRISNQPPCVKWATPCSPSCFQEVSNSFIHSFIHS